MKSLMYVTITLYMLNYVLSQITYCENITPTQISNCTDHKITQEQKELYKGYDPDTCCYVTFTDSWLKVTQCWAEKKDIVNEQYIKMIEERYGYTNFSIKCEIDSYSNSIWLSLSLTFLLFGLLF